MQKFVQFHTWNSVQYMIVYIYRNNRVVSVKAKEVRWLV